MSKKTFNPADWKETNKTESQKPVAASLSGSPAGSDIETITQRIESSAVDIAPNYADWRDLGFALADDYFDTQLLFVSPSGDGLKWIIPIDTSQTPHSEYFTAVAKYVLQTYCIEVDKSGRDISRACFLAYDPNAFIHPNNL